ncbi:MAG TPA: T9SS type A sorting domain-containing protein [Bacteroidia bacterium]|nr:T9SS type A sorting domain-containing protein [Bacteroidia bacterium]
MIKRIMRIVLIFGCVGIFNTSLAQVPDWMWAKSAGGTAIDGGKNVATDAAGNIIAIGFFENSSITFGAITLTSGGSYDIFVVKYDPSGNVLWAKGAGGNEDDFGEGITTDLDGNIIATGAFRSSAITFGTTTLINANPGYTDIFIVKFDSSGNVIWANSSGGTDEDGAISVATDLSGNIITMNTFLSPLISVGGTTLINSGIVDLFVAKYDSAGNNVWVKSAGGADSDQGCSVSVGVTGNIMATGYFRSSSITFGTTTITNSGSPDGDIFVVKYDSSGNVLWARSAEGLNEERAYSISIDKYDNSILTGYFASTVLTFNTITLANNGSNDIFVAKYDSSGNVMWANSAGGTNSEVGYSIASVTGGNIIVTGTFSSSLISFGTSTLTNTGYGDLFVTKYDASGNSIWAISTTGSGSEIGYGTISDSDGNVIATGTFNNGPVTFGAISLMHTGTPGYSDFFIAKLDPDSITSVPNLQSSPFNLQLFPNPTTGTTQLTLNTKHNAPLECEIINMMGERVFTSPLTPLQRRGETAAQLDVSFLAKGIYLVRVGEGEWFENKKLVIE